VATLGVLHGESRVGEKYPPNLIWVMPAKGSLWKRRAVTLAVLRVRGLNSFAGS